MSLAKRLKIKLYINSNYVNFHDERFYVAIQKAVNRVQGIMEEDGASTGSHRITFKGEKVGNVTLTLPEDQSSSSSS